MVTGDPRCRDCGSMNCVGLLGRRCPSKDYPEYLTFTWDIPYSVFNLNGDSFADGCFNNLPSKSDEELNIFEKMYRDAYRKQPR